MIYFVAGLAFLSFLLLIAIAILLVLLVRQHKQLTNLSVNTAQRTLSVQKGVLSEGEAIAAFMEYVAAFQGEDMLFNKDLRENASSHLMQLQQTLRNRLEDANAQ